MNRIRIDNGRILDPATKLDATGSVCIADGKILAVGQAPADFQADRSIDAEGLWVCPGIIDLCARPGKGGQVVRASLEREVTAAVTAGVTTLCCPPDIQPLLDSPAAIELVLQGAADDGRIRIQPIAALTHGLEGDRLAEMYTLHQAGAVAVSNGRRPLASNEILRRALEYAAGNDYTVFIHPEDHHLGRQGVAHEGEMSTRMGLPPIPETAETVALATALLLTEQTGARVHFCRLSTARGVEMLARARQQGLPVTADVDICHLYLTELDLDGYNSNCHLQPPLRRMEDRQALLQGVIDGTLDAVCSDHTPLGADAKLAPFNLTRPGASTIEVLLPLMLDLATPGGLLTPLMVFEKLARNPADILGVPHGRLAVGHAADLILVDPLHSWTLTPDALHSAGRNTPFVGWELQGRVMLTLMDGRIVHEHR